MSIQMSAVPLHKLGTREEAAARGVPVSTDWAGEAVIAAADATTWHAELAAASEAHAREHTAWVEATEAYERDRLAAARDAGDAAFYQALARGVGQPRAAAAQRESFIHAGAQFERTHPRPRLGGQPGSQLIYVAEAEEGSLVARLAGKLRGPARPAPDLQDVIR